jgi:hypothetical protein
MSARTWNDWRWRMLPWLEWISAYKVLVLALVVGGALSGLITARLVPPTYQATAAYRIVAEVDDPFSPIVCRLGPEPWAYRMALQFDSFVLRHGIPAPPIADTVSEWIHQP